MTLSRPTFTSSVTIGWQRSGCIRSGWRGAAGLAGQSLRVSRRSLPRGPRSCEGNGRTTSAAESQAALATDVRVTTDTLTVDLCDGRSTSVPLGWFPRLVHGSTEERSRWRLIGRGEGIHWPDLDEDISIAGLLAGRPSGEQAASLARWQSARGLAALPAVDDST